ncbi:unnamed protein product, partial [Didymodactylos carnosus]
CWSFDGTVTGWKKYTGKPVIRPLDETATQYTNASVSMGECAFGQTRDDGYKLEQRINLTDYSLLINTGEVKYTLSAYFGGTGGVCQEEQALVFNPIFESAFLKNPYINASADEIRWEYAEVTGVLDVEQRDFRIHIFFGYKARACLIDNADFRLEPKVK